MSRCKYTDCHRETYINQEYCLFHTPADVKKTFVDKETFVHNLTHEIMNPGVNCSGFKIPWKIDFSNHTFTNKLDFTDWIFYEFVDFTKTEFGNFVDFTNTTFADGVCFNGAIFNDDVYFHDTKFRSKTANENQQGKSGLASFLGAKFIGEAHFGGAEFSVRSASFSESIIKKAIRFGSNVIEGDLIFFNTRLLENAIFSFKKPIFRKSDKIPSIHFQSISFNEFATFFENIRLNEDYRESKPEDRPIFYFRLCQLRNVYFMLSNVSLFSFYRSAFFEESFFNSCYWDYKKENLTRFLPVIKYRRKYIICEDLVYDSLPIKRIHADINKMSIRKMASENFGYDEISLLYLRMKTAADRAKDYHLASWLYFNEFETKRKSFLSTTKLKKILRIVLPNKFWLYSSYKFFAGYGEKPFWSFFWFWIFTIGFSFLHLFNGIKTSNGSFNYDWGLPFPGWGNFLEDLGYSALFTLYRVIPVSYLPYERDKYGLLYNYLPDFALSFLNTVVLIILIIFISVGLKRHFRRF